MRNEIVLGDLKYIHRSLNESEKERFNGSTVLITGCAGFLGYYFMQFLAKYADELNINKIVGIDNFMLRKPMWLENLQKDSSLVEIHTFDIVKDAIGKLKIAEDANIIIHMASIASPAYYRKYPIETLDANIWGLRKLLEFYKEKSLRSFLFFSSSEVYGDPLLEFIPTDENYRGNVATLGPRACYDEAKRVGETMCYIFAGQYDLPIKIVRPFNNFGPGMSLDDKRAAADFAKAVFENRDIEIYSDGTPTRTFCYVADAILGYLKALAYQKFDYFNIGIDRPEISIKRLAEIYAEEGRKILGYKGKIQSVAAPEKEYLTHNPNRRCPKIDKAGKLLGYNPGIYVEEGVRKFLEFIKVNGGKL